MASEQKQTYTEEVSFENSEGKTTPEEGVLLSQESDVTPTVSVVMPTLDEKDGIGECIERIKTAFCELGVQGEIIVSDSSDDRTPEIAARLGATVVHPDEDGYGYAYRYGFRYARGEYVVIGDADTTYDFEELPKLFRLVSQEGADMAIGSRLDGEIKDGAMPPLHQYVGNPLLTWFLNMFYDAGVSDAHSGFRVIRRDVLQVLELETNGMEFASEMIMEAGARGLEIAEEPITYHEREGEATLDSFRDGWRHVRFMLLNAPGYLFLLPGAVLALTGLVVMLTAYTGIEFGGLSLGVHSMVAGSLATLSGSQIASLGVFVTIASDPIRKPNDPVTGMVTEHVRLEHGATEGLLLFGAGSVYGGLLLARWVSSGFDQLPLLMQDIAAVTFVVLGIQIVFESFCMSAIAEDN